MISSISRYDACTVAVKFALCVEVVRQVRAAEVDISVVEAESGCLVVGVISDLLYLRIIDFPSPFRLKMIHNKFATL